MYKIQPLHLPSTQVICHKRAAIHMSVKNEIIVKTLSYDCSSQTPVVTAQITANSLKLIVF